jgi:hypothetical protein
MLIGVSTWSYRLNVSGAGHPEFENEPVLEGPPDSLDAALRLGAWGGDGADPKLEEGPSELGRRPAVDELLPEH